MTECAPAVSMPGAPGYEISRSGHIFSVMYNWRGCGRREMIQRLNSSGYPSVRLTVRGQRKRYAVHKLVIQTFIGKCPNGYDQIRHLDGNCMNNNVDNLAWGTAQDNAADRERHGRTSRGWQHSVAIKRGLAKAGFEVNYESK